MKLSTRVAHERLTRICFIDYDREMALVAERKNPETGDHEILGVGRLSKLRGTDEAEFALLVSDRFQGQGLGTELLRRLLQIGRDEKIRPDRRRHPPREPRDAARLPEARLPADSHRRRASDQGRDRPLIDDR